MFYVGQDYLQVVYSLGYSECFYGLKKICRQYRVM